jgi:AcrR family transcriptional regulator
MNDTDTTGTTPNLSEQIDVLLAEHESSGTSIAKLARRAGIPPHRLYYVYRKRLAESTAKTESAFAPVRILGPSPSATALELNFANGMTLRIPRGADPGQVASLVQALELC